MRNEKEKDLLREWGHISEGNPCLNFNGWLFDEFRSLGRLIKKHRVYCENSCSIPNFDLKLIDSQEEKIKRKIEGLNTWFKVCYERQQLQTLKTLRFEFQRDPRGLTAKIYILNPTDTEGFLLYHSLGL
jgi:hypothetical protein